jgi:putative permease
MIEIPKISQQLTVNLFHFLDDYPQIISVEARESLVAQASFEKHTQKILEISATWLMTIIPSALTVIVYLVMIPTIVFFMNKDHLYFFNIIRTFYPEKCPQLTVIWHRIKDELELFVAAKIAHMIIIWALSLALFLMFSLHYAYLLSIPMALTVFIPYVGTAIATIPLVLIAYLQFGFDYQFIALMSSYAALQALEANIIVPILFGQANDMHPIVILGAVLFFGEWFGVSGMFFAIPAAAIIKVLYQYWPKTFEEIVH